MDNNVEREYQQITAHADLNGPLGPYLRWVRQRLLPIFAKHDALAITHATRHRGVLKFIYITAAAVVALVAAQALFLPELPFLIWGEVGLIGLMLWRQRRSDRAGDHRLWLEHRYVAEHLRTRIFSLPLRDLSGNIDGHMSLLTSEERIGLWKTTLEDLAPEDRPVVDMSEGFEALKRLVSDAWCADQRTYHLRTARKNHGALERVERWGIALLCLTLAAAALHAMGVGHHSFVEHVLTFLALVLPATSGAMNAIKHSLEMHKMGLRSERMSQGLARFEDAIRAAETPEELEERILELERFFLWEHEEWYALLSFKKADVG